MNHPMANISLRNTRPRHALLRLRARAWPILQTALAVVGSWYLALLLLPTDRPVFASIAAVIAIGATYGQRRERAIELIGGVVLGIGLADLLVTAIGSGPLQLGVMVILAMSLAVALGGGPVLVTEAAVSAILLVVLEPSGAALPPTRLIEALVGGGVALAISALAFPLNPVLLVSRSVHDVFGRLGRTLEQVSSALDERDEVRALAALEDARELDGYVRALDDALVLGRETARFSPGRRSSLGELNRYERSAPHIDLAVRNARMLTRHVLRFLRSGGSPPEGLGQAVHDLGQTVWTLAAELDDPAPDGTEARRLAARAAAQAAESFETDRDLAVAEIVVGVRATAIDLLRAMEATAPNEDAPERLPTGELLFEHSSRLPA
jgi:uncharacterized membrane protein YgaE (UPF0421/DUF939 family)